MFEYPENVVRIMRSQVESAKRAISHHFHNRNKEVGYRLRVHEWIVEYRRIVSSSGYDKALKQIQCR